ncbi:DNA replication factor C, large subunit [Ramicandelaber brevisporus]|nr:DNA replication factor C, large subunit [Ramicandelaber brevisporus]
MPPKRERRISESESGGSSPYGEVSQIRAAPQPTAPATAARVSIVDSDAGDDAGDDEFIPIDMVKGLQKVQQGKTPSAAATAAATKSTPARATPARNGKGAAAKPAAKTNTPRGSAKTKAKAKIESSSDEEESEDEYSESSEESGTDDMDDDMDDDDDDEEEEEEEEFSDEEEYTVPSKSTKRTAAKASTKASAPAKVTSASASASVSSKTATKASAPATSKVANAKAIKSLVAAMSSAAAKSDTGDEDDVDDGKKPALSYRDRMKQRAMVAAPTGLSNEELPAGAANCLNGMNFVITGVLPSLTRDACANLIKKYAGKVTTGISGKTSYLVSGVDPGESKIKQAKDKKVDVISEQELFDLIRTTKGTDDEFVTEEDMFGPPKKSTASTASSATKGKGKGKATAAPKKDMESDNDNDDDSNINGRNEPARVAVKAESVATVSSLKPSTAQPTKPEKASATAPVKKETASQPVSKNEPLAESQLWTDKWAPKTMDEFIGNKKPITELKTWLEKWMSGEHKGGKMDRTSTEFNAVLISGPPGIGKTTAAHLIGKMVGFEVLELNASDVRNKKTIAEQLNVLLGSHSLTEFFHKPSNASNGKSGSSSSSSSRSGGGRGKVVVVMDEVDGMSGGDRGGTQELIKLIDSTRVPIICICNDRQSTKVRSLANHCLDLKFIRPSAQQMKSRIATICFREGLRFAPNVIDKLVEMTQNDIRQVLNLLSSWKLISNTITFDESDAYAKLNKKVTTLGPFEVVREWLSSRLNLENSFSEKLDMYFYDFGINPLMVHENYPKCTPVRSQSLAEHSVFQALEKGVINRAPQPEISTECASLHLHSKAADAISEADMIDRMIHGNQEWSLMPVHGAMSCIIPSFYVNGYNGGVMYTFPNWLGKNSSAQKGKRLVRELQLRSRLVTGANSIETRLDYWNTFSDRFIIPLANADSPESTDEAVDSVIDLMDEYYLTKDDYDAVLELQLLPFNVKNVNQSNTPNRPGITQKMKALKAKEDVYKKNVPAGTKSKLTRKFNAMYHPTAFTDIKALKQSASNSKKKAIKAEKGLKPDLEDVYDEDDYVDADDDDDEDSQNKTNGDDGDDISAIDSKLVKTITKGKGKGKAKAKAPSSAAAAAAAAASTKSTPAPASSPTPVASNHSNTADMDIESDTEDLTTPSAASAAPKAAPVKKTTRTSSTDSPVPVPAPAPAPKKTPATKSATRTASTTATTTATLSSTATPSTALKTKRKAKASADDDNEDAEEAKATPVVKAATKSSSMSLLNFFQSKPAAKSAPAGDTKPSTSTPTLLEEGTSSKQIMKRRKVAIIDDDDDD